MLGTLNLCLNNMHPFQTIKAEDEGKKGSTAILNIAITDINDQNPEFQNLPYTFRLGGFYDLYMVDRVRQEGVKEVVCGSGIGRIFGCKAQRGKLNIIS
jgi:hypothetical protein